MHISHRRQRHGKSYGLLPDYFADSIEDIDFSVLKQLGVKYVALDVDQTIAHHNAMTLAKSEDIADFLKVQVANGTLEGIFIASNSRRDLRDIAAEVNAQIVPATLSARKPGLVFYKKLLTAAQCRPGEIAMVGDRLLTDILGGNRAGLITILVPPSGPDALFDRLVLRRFWGRQYLRRHRA